MSFIESLQRFSPESRRLASVERYAVFGSLPEEDFDKITRLTADVLQTSICLLSIVGETDVWIKSQIGLDATSLPRANSFCLAVVETGMPLVVPDAGADPRFCDHFMVREWGARFYAGAPLTATDGSIIGTLCVFDRATRPSFSNKDLSFLQQVASLAMDWIERRFVNRISDILVPFAHVAHQALVTTNAAGRITFWNDGAERMFGRSQADAIGCNVDIIVPERLRAAHREGLARVASGAPSGMTGRVVEILAMRCDGSEFPAELSLSVWHGSNGIGMGAQIQDISERRAREERLHHMANHDGLTGLLNRRSFLMQIEERLERDGTAAVFVLGLDGFKDVNDSLGHAVGDTLLQALALRLLATRDPAEILARLGGDEFAILLPVKMDLGEVAARANALIETIRRPFSVSGHELHLSTSVGVAVAPLHAEDAEELIVRADLALFKAKDEGGRRYRVFDTGLENQLGATRAFQEELRVAFSERQFELHFQPQVRLDDGMPIGAEALLRWNHPMRGLLRPAAFMPVLETHPLAYEIGCWVLDQSCRTLAEWRSQGLAPLRMSVNLFAAQLRSGTLVEVVEATLASHGLAPGDLELEITETIALRQDDKELDALRSLCARGVGIAFDDFDTGFASLSALKDFPLTRLKIDQSFVRDVCSNRHSEAIVRGVITIGRSLGLDVIAEGIETEEQVAHLREWRCASGQGYFYGRPMPAHAFANTFLVNAPAADTWPAR
ncbi:putative bifunctional diguanylate cyclase/phosphodiesterase [Novosphingobium sp.]|uniref:putative bifunctional diguanylate cyclase/phosphodiesterase n=1 Tax=Novosphingobium sp. TaxID=1874826 RepID=UPI003D0F7955